MKLGLLGHPVAHSASQVMHEAALARADLAGSYALVDVLAPELGARVDALRSDTVQGYNVTIPHKAAVAALCDRLAPDAARIGVVNTLVRSEAGEVVGHNTDLPGLVRALGGAFETAPWRGRPAAVLGAGGAARAAVLAAYAVGVGEVRVANRTQQRADALVEELAPWCPSGSMSVGDDEGAACADAALVLHATSLGMSTSPGDDAYQHIVTAATEALRDASPEAAVFDLVYRPEPTPWVAAAQGLGLQAASGLEMLVQQAALAFELWTGRQPDVATMRAAARRLLAA